MLLWLFVFFWGYVLALWLSMCYLSAFDSAATPTGQERAAARDRRIAELESELGIGNDPA